MSLHTIDRWLRDRARATPDRVAVDLEGSLTTYGELAERSEELALSLSHGEVVSTLTGNSVEHIALFFACAKVGAILHPISWRLAPAEVAFQLDDAGSDVFVVEDEQRELAEAALALANVVPMQTLQARRGTPGDGPADEDGLLPSCRSSTSAAGTCSHCSRGGRAHASSSSGPSTRAVHCAWSRRSG